ncbi:MAG: hypothetical protein RMK98_05160 [Bacteroidia bacterium]|nr:hypothetical protein [Bacteroidia bacterium]
MVKTPGKVISFKPSSYERNQLLMYIAPPKDNGINSLQPINKPGLNAVEVKVPLHTLDDYF